ncbi:MAG: AI-2E family transporter [Planctomycetes bacterium]|nr:AI-2E family transporter [Planctomycetota bacterium]
MSDPAETVRRWAPHVTAWLLAALALMALWQVLAPIHLPIFTGAALAILAHPVLCAPCDRLLHRLFPQFAGRTRRLVAAAATSLTLAGGIAALAVLLLWAALGSIDLTLGSLWRMALGDQATIQQLCDRLIAAAADLHRLYPAVPLDVDRLRPLLEDLLGRTRVGPELLRFLVTGTGGVLIELVLAGITMFYLLAHGPRLAHRLLALLPLDRPGRMEMRRRFRAEVHAVVAGSGGRALAQGIAWGLLAWAIAGFNPVLVGAIGVVAALLPLIGAAFIWLPLASLLASQGRWTEAVCLAAACQTAAWLLDHLSNRVVKALDVGQDGRGWLLFLAVVGGILAYGPRGVVLGPVVVIIGLTLTKFQCRILRADHSAAASMEPIRRSSGPTRLQ